MIDSKGHDSVDIDEINNTFSNGKTYSRKIS